MLHITFQLHNFHYDRTLRNKYQREKKEQTSHLSRRFGTLVKWIGLNVWAIVRMRNPVKPFKNLFVGVEYYEY